VISSSADRGKMFAIWKEQLRCPWSLDHAEMQGPNFPQKKRMQNFHAILVPSCHSVNQQTLGTGTNNPPAGGIQWEKKQS